MRRSPPGVFVPTIIPASKRRMTLREDILKPRALSHSAAWPVVNSACSGVSVKARPLFPLLPWRHHTLVSGVVKRWHVYPPPQLSYSRGVSG